ncbi:carbohydrate ABC transporter membrane protein 2 (CUT1 family) [Jatrophihabitans sp. GAS493]|uniref:carbohydrate ABC transporter permease n=1 Tax=Jatrophihabitans sp. GAS493 TaxID=1907575 RepID=UPI000BB75D67|nr:carbohydrate ABC transporter permease [Jatrophihabitans sp. GAS493]SOD73302.1 carbohydrate ABC transporter membrane protein 2 (CUT1 family) [Jatrophihabitans sp. GAS493]
MTNAPMIPEIPGPLEARPEPKRKVVRQAFSNPAASIVVILITVAWTVPVLGLLVTSLRPKEDSASTGWWTFFAHPHLTFSNYNTVLFKGGYNVSGGLFPYVVNSLAITIPATVIPIIIAAMAAYALAWVRFKGSDVLFFLIFALQVVPLQMSLVPLLQLYNKGVHLGTITIIPNPNLKGSLAEVWISHTMFSLPLAIFLLHNFISALPESLIEAARVDGASHLRIFRTIVLPLSLPAIASFAIFQFLWVWNDLLIALTFAGKTPATQPLTAQLQQLTGSLGSHLELLTAGGFVSIVIPMIVFFALQRYFVRGMLAGSVKG